MFALNMPIKSWLASFMVLLGVGVLVELVVNVLAESVGLLRQLRGVL
jgi:type III secretory pathway component EscT